MRNEKINYYNFRITKVLHSQLNLFKLDPIGESHDIDLF